MNRRFFSLFLGCALTFSIPTTALLAESQPKTKVAASTIITGDMVLGNKDAAVELIEYASFTCPHCRRFHETVYPLLKKEYIDTGKVKFIFREVYFDRLGLWGGLIARCGGESKYFGLVDLLFRQQNRWAKAAKANEITNELYRIGRIAGLSNEKMTACMGDRDRAEILVDEYQKNIKADNVNATPSLLINKKLYSNMSYEKLSRLLTEALGE